MSDKGFFRDSSIYIRAVNEARYLNIAVLFIVQSVTRLPQSIREAASVVLGKRLNDKNEVFTIEKMMNFSSEEQEKWVMLMKIADGIFIDKERGAIPVPVLVPEYPTQAVPDELIKGHQAGDIERITGGVRREKPVSTEAPEPAPDEQVSYESRLIMEDLKKFPFDFQGERGTRLSMNPRTIADVLEELVKQEWIRRHDSKINTGKGKGQFQPYLFTDKAITKFGKQKIVGKGSLEHAFWQYRCAKHFSNRGYKVEIECFLADGTSIDVVATKGGERVAVEIELNDTPHIKDNILKCMRERFDHIIIAVYGSKLRKRVQQTTLSDLEIEPWLKCGKLELEMLSALLD
ncbi:MAG: hypothetical protein ACE1ZG_07250 [Gammaproteobacteria bacterium]